MFVTYVIISNIKMTSTGRDLDLIVWGATGFTGELACAYLNGNSTKIYSFDASIPAAPANLRWAISGRNHSKLQALNTGVEIIICEADNKAKIEEMVKRTKVIAGFAGPFIKYSDLVVEACCKFGTHWVDITGEVGWSRMCNDRWGDKARATGACIVNHCGYDSIPSDLGALFAANALLSKNQHSPIRTITNYQQGLGGFSGGSLQTGLAKLTHPVVLSKDVDPDDLFLVGGEPSGGARKEDAYLTDSYFDKELNQWIGPFGMSSINSRVARRSNMLLNYGAKLSYSEVQVCNNEKQANKSAKQAKNPTPPEIMIKMIESGRLPKPGEGPPPSLRKICRFQATLIAVNENGDDVCCTVTGGECGYEETAKMCIESALSLIYEAASCPGIQRGGFHTPASCMGNVLINRLHRQGICFNVLADAKRSNAKYLARLSLAEFNENAAKLKTLKSKM